MLLMLRWLVCHLKEMNITDHKFKQKARELHKLAVARLDIIEAQNACEYVINEVNNQGDPMYYPHFVTLVICYARPFTNNNVYGALNKKWSKFPNDAANGMHKQLLDARNTFIAHSDGNVRSMQITPKEYIIPGTQRKIDYHTCQVKKFYISLENFPLARSLSE